METKYDLDAVMGVAKDEGERLALFSLINLGLIESLANGVVDAAEGVRQLYFAENCLFVRKHLQNKLADRLMGHGAQLPDLFDALPAQQAQREFLHELSIMRSLCLQILEGQRRVA